MTRTLALEVTSRTIPDPAHVTAQTVAALPPSSLDPAAHLMRVYINADIIVRAFDPVLEQP